jgi:hypothetical protein
MYGNDDVLAHPQGLEPERFRRSCDVDDGRTEPGDVGGNSDLHGRAQPLSRAAEL